METSIARKSVHAGILFLEIKTSEQILRGTNDTNEHEIICVGKVPKFINIAPERLYENVYRTVTQFAVYDSQWLHLYYSPLYSPELNRIEIIWKHA